MTPEVETWTEYGWRNPDTGKTVHVNELFWWGDPTLPGWTRMGRTVTASIWLPVDK